MKQRPADNLALLRGTQKLSFGPDSDSRATLASELAKLYSSRFIPSLVKQRKLLGEVLFISFMLQLFGLVSPLFFQLVMDKVLVHKGVTLMWW